MSRLQQGISKLNNLNSHSHSHSGGSSISRLSSPSVGPGGSSKNFEELKRQIHSKLVERLDSQLAASPPLGAQQVRDHGRRLPRRAIDQQRGPARGGDSARDFGNFQRGVHLGADARQFAARRKLLEKIGK